MGNVTEQNREPNYDDCTEPEAEGSSVYFRSFTGAHRGAGCIATLSVGRLQHEYLNIYVVAFYKLNINGVDIYSSHFKYIFLCTFYLEMVTDRGRNM
jgi:hypothetical protein